MTIAPAQDLSLASHPYRPAARFAVAVAGVVVILAGLWFAWAAVARHRRDRAVAAVRARGEPTVDADLPSPPLAGADNAAVAWRAAMAAVSQTVYGPSSSASTYPSYPPFSPLWWTDARASEAANAAVFPLADRAAAMARARWLPGPSVVSANLFPSVPYNAAREVANVLGDSALLVHFDAPPDDDRCLDRLTDLYQLADAIDQQPSEISRLVAIGIRAMADERVQVIAADLDVGPPGSVRRGRVVALLQRLATEPTPQERALPLRAERVIALDDLDGQRGATPLLSPMVDVTAGRAMRYLDVDERAAVQADFAAAQAVYANDTTGRAALAAGGGPPASPFRPSRWFDYGVGYPAMNFIRTNWRCRAGTRVAAVAVAVRLYRADHDDRWPATLSALVPAYLSAVPTDPEAAGSPPVGYLVRPRGCPDGRDRPLLYLGGGDSDPATLMPPPKPMYGYSNGAVQWIDLARWTPKAGGR